MIEQNFHISFVSKLALREKQIQQNYRPVIAVHKWFARRPGTLFRSLLLSEFIDEPVGNTYYRNNYLGEITIADPFMGGGTPLLEANRLGCAVVGTDINPMSAWIVREEIDSLELDTYEQVSEDLLSHLSREIGDLYKTRCPLSGEESDVKYFLWVKTATCVECQSRFDLFPSYLIAENRRHPFHVLFCPSCHQLNEVKDIERPGLCSCGLALNVDGPVSRNRCPCFTCGHINKAPFTPEGPPTHRLFAIEYHNPLLSKQAGRLFKVADADDLRRSRDAEVRLRKLAARFVPDDHIPEGDETRRLHKWRYNFFRDLFNTRQLLALETSARFIDRVGDRRLKRALATNFSDLLRYQNMLCRYDTMALKSLDIFSVHGFPVSYIQAESNFLGIRNGRNLPVGSGGWVNIIEKYKKAKRYCSQPFEIAFNGIKKVVVPLNAEWIGETDRKHRFAPSRSVDIRCAPAEKLQLPVGSLDGIFTDPPYFGMVQYGELMHFCYVWLRKLMGRDTPGLESETTRHPDELTANETAGRDIVHFAEGLARVYIRLAAALRSGAPLVFTYHHNKQVAYLAAAMAILDSGLTCSASLPCPAEMGGSIHIKGTGSSIVDTVFVCRKHGVMRRDWLFKNAEELCALLRRELLELQSAGVKPTAGDIRCIAFGHLTRMAIWKLRPSWDDAQSTATKLSLIRKSMDSLATIADIRIDSIEAKMALERE